MDAGDDELQPKRPTRATHAASAIAGVAIALAACAHDPPKAARAPADEWTPLSWEERHDTMTFLVLPNMARMFQRFEQKRDPDLACTSCHGADAEARSYAMPGGALAALDPRDPGAGRDPRVVAFMRDEVGPAMARMIGAPVTCFTCHEAKR